MICLEDYVLTLEGVMKLMKLFGEKMFQEKTLILF